MLQLHRILLIICFFALSLVKSFAQETPDDVTFGIYCGHCSGQCAILYHYSSADSNTLYVDSTDSFFRKHDAPIRCNTPVKNPDKIIHVRQLIQDIPDELLFRTELSRTFGCPDCSDGCGIYLEFMHHQMKYRFYIDTRSNQLQGSMKIFSEEVKHVVRQLKSD